MRRQRLARSLLVAARGLRGRSSHSSLPPDATRAGRQYVVVNEFHLCVRRPRERAHVAVDAARDVRVGRAREDADAGGATQLDRDLDGHLHTVGGAALADERAVVHGARELSVGGDPARPWRPS